MLHDRSFTSKKQPESLICFDRLLLAGLRKGKPAVCNPAFRLLFLGFFLSTRLHEGYRNRLPGTSVIFLHCTLDDVDIVKEYDNRDHQ
jgi:hypothetical protein